MFEPSPEPETEPLADRLAQLPGLDVRVAMRNMGNKWPSVVRIMNTVVRTYERGLPQLLDKSGEEAAGVGEWAAACHSAKGAFSSIGAQEVTSSLATFERKLKSGASRRDLFPEACVVHLKVRTFVARLRTELVAEATQ